ncbi:hypothetical protein [Salmonirosea aquatica]|uniref:Uncharacterized protein n=1 Tax=Salmonirosea aquatica TaxID=2654236 RepID=A0A7C9FY69_9BACT|nr:hypothetical protein [Cytophagaceae bacterium SJW1-29]
MTNPNLTAFLEKNHFVQGDKRLKYIRETELGPLELWFQPLKRTKYAGEIRYQEFVGCRVTLAMKLNVPTRFMVGDSNAISNWLANYVNKKRGRELIKLKDPRSLLSAWVASKAWSENILQDVEVQEALTTLFHTDDKIRRQQSLSLDPLQLTYAYRMKTVDLEALEALIPPYLLVAEKVKQAEEPQEKLSLTSTENYVLKHPYRIAIMILLGLMLLLVVPFIIIGLFVFFK